jgi:L-Ala-D/L-Glu epimerase
MSSIKSIRFYEVVRPLKVTFSTALGKKDVIRSIIVKVKLNSGLSGLGECPTSFAQKHETVPRIKEILTEASCLFLNTPIAEYEWKIKELRKKYHQYLITVSGLDVALFRAYLACKHELEHDRWGGLHNSLETDITIPFITDPVLLGKWVGHMAAVGFSAFKLKVSGDIEADKIYISHIYEKLKNETKGFTIRLDGNQGYTEKTFLRLIDFLIQKDYMIELFEQPLPKTNYKGLKEIKKRSPMPVILDETVFTVHDLMRVIQEDLCHGVNIKIAKSGIGESLNIFSMAKAHNLRLMIGCMTETMTGLSAGIYFALGTGGFDYIDLDAIHFLHHKNRYGDINIEGPRYTRITADS